MMLKRNHIQHTACILLTLFALACEPEACFHGSGKQATAEVPMDAFRYLDVEGLMRVILVPDSHTYISFEGGENNLKFMEATRQGDTVTLRNNNTCFYFRDYEKVRAYIHSNTVHQINLFDACKLESSDSLTQRLFVTVQSDMAEVDMMVNTESLWFYNNTTTGGRFRFSGYVDYLNFGASYMGSFNLENLVFRRGKVNNSSLSDLYVNPLEYLAVEIHNKGNIYYSGTPKVVVDSVSGSGQLLLWE